MPQTVATDALTMPPEGVPFGRYLIRKRIAKGGMGEVLLADQVGPLGPVRPVALKRMLPKLARDPRAARMFLDEMATAAQLNHPNIATTYDFGEVDGIYFIAMEYVEGLSLNELIKSLGPLPVGGALSIVASIAEALSYAHTRKSPQGELSPVVHRDVSPQNIMISTSGAVKLLDFGIARAEAAVHGGRLEGKLNYAAPEQLQGEAPDRRSDLWALGVVLYEALTAAKPFENANPMELLMAALAGDYVPLEIRRPEAAPVSRVVARSLLKEQTRRWPTAEGFRAACIEVAEEYISVSAQALAELVAKAGGPRTSVLGVEHFTSLNLAALNAGGSALDPSNSNAPALPDTLVPQATPPSPRKPLSKPGNKPLSKPANKPLQEAVDDSALVAEAIGQGWHKIALLAAVFAVLGGGVAALWRVSQRAPITVAEEEQTPITVQPFQATAAATPPKPVEAPPAVAVAHEPARSEPRQDPVETPKHHGHKKGRPKPEATSESKPTTPAKDQPTETKGAPGVGLLSVRAVPWAKVTLDGRFIGNSPLANLPVPEGAHTLLLSRSDGDHATKTAEIRVKAGAPTRVVVEFESGKLAIEQP
jgi:serine/threonine-protein kinase